MQLNAPHTVRHQHVHTSKVEGDENNNGNGCECSHHAVLIEDFTLS